MAPNQKQTQKQATRSQILEAASALLFRGIRESSVAKVMKAAGLTVGGFYAHFRSKDELVLECFRRMLQKSKARIETLPEEKRLESFYELYLSQTHRDQPEAGCPVLPLLFDAAGKNGPFREAFAHELEKAFRERLELFAQEGKPEALDHLLASFSTLVGAQLLARATKGSDLSDRILAAAKKSLEKEA